MNSNTIHRWLIVIAAAAIVTGLLSAKPRKWDADALARKSDYLMMQAGIANIDDRSDDYYALLSHIHNANPGYTPATYDMGIFMLQLTGADSLSRVKGYDLIRKGYEADKDDYYTAIQTARVAHLMGDTDLELSAYARIHNAEPELTGITYMYADALARSGVEGGEDRALALYDSIEVTDGLDADLALERVKLYGQRNDTASILREGYRLLQSSPMNVDNNMLMARIFASLDASPDSTLLYLNRACEIDSTDARAVYSRAMFFYEQGDTAAFDREIFRVLKMENLNPETKQDIMRGYISELYGDSTQTPRIFELFRHMTAATPHDAKLRNLYAAFLFLNDKTREGVEQQLLAVDLDPSDVTGWQNLVSGYMQLDDLDKAAEQAARGLTYFPDNARLHLIAGAVKMQKNDNAGALEDMMRADSLVDRAADYQLASSIKMSLGDIYTRLDSIDAAITAYEKAITIDPHNYMAMNNYAYLLACSERELDIALAMVKEAMATDPELSTWADTYAWVLFARGEYEEAREAIDRTLMLMATHDEEPQADVLDHAGDIYWHCDRPDRAMQFWQEALEIDPSNDLIRQKVEQKTYVKQ